MMHLPPIRTACGTTASFDDGAGYGFRCDSCGAVIGSVGMPRRCKDLYEMDEVVNKLKGKKMLTFNSNSLHYKLALLGGLSKYDDDSNICEYTRHVLFGCLFAMLAGLLIAFLGTILSHMLFAVGFSLVYGILIFTDAAITGYITAFIGLIWFGIWKLSESAKERRNNARDEPKKPDGFVKHAYKSWKEKYCVKVAFTNKPEDSGWNGS